jgi:hypothetical protein
VIIKKTIKLKIIVWFVILKSKKPKGSEIKGIISNCSRGLTIKNLDSILKKKGKLRTPPVNS